LNAAPASWCLSVYNIPGLHNREVTKQKKRSVHEISTPEGLDTATKYTQKKSKRKGRNKQEIVTVCQAEPEPVKAPIDLKAQENSSSSSVKKKSKFVILYARERRDKLAVLLPGRQPCECLAQKHRLINNCLSCGWIVCEQEGSGPCLFCGSVVCTTEEQEILQRDSNKSQKLRKKLMGEGTEREYLPHQEARMKAGLEKAVKHKDKLLEFDKNSVKRTQVLDDESDYFATDSNQWLSPGEREALHRKITLDFARRRVLDEGENLTPYYQKFDETVKAINTGSFGQTPKHSVSTDRQHLRELVNPNIMQAAPEWVDVSGRGSWRKSSSKTVSGTQKSERSRLRLQDKELQEISDGGWCLSMHQPCASLLVKGIKRVEGRMWYTSHRGRLWIAAAANRPAPQEIAEVEAMHRHIYKEEPKFPTEYPTGCLLGCVNVTDCLSQEQFREHEQSTSPFVFICSNSQELVVKFPMKGKHKICKSCLPLFMCRL
uniref:Activating signal cointegrator 1-like n=1 Tax=Sinocyclocheilus grahami TaxID=75366 RepID=A0A672QY18_SINGR